jgi:hypothetical protein
MAQQRMLVVWQVLTNQQPYQHYAHERSAYKCLTWSWQLDEDQRRKMTRPPFARYSLMHLGIGDELQRVALNPKHPHRLANGAEMRKQWPEPHLSGCYQEVLSGLPLSLPPTAIRRGEAKCRFSP